MHLYVCMYIYIAKCILNQKLFDSSQCFSILKFFSVDIKFRDYFSFGGKSCLEFSFFAYFPCIVLGTQIFFLLLFLRSRWYIIFQKKIGVKSCLYNNACENVLLLFFLCVHFYNISITFNTIAMTVAFQFNCIFVQHFKKIYINVRIVIF